MLLICINWIVNYPAPSISDILILLTYYHHVQPYPDSSQQLHPQPVQHILLPVQLGKAVFRLSTDMKKMVTEWVGGGTACGDAVWLRFMMPKLREAQRKIEMRQWRKAFGILLGLQFFAHGDEEWIMDQGVYRNYREFAGWFSDYSAAWVEVLDRSDS